MISKKKPVFDPTTEAPRRPGRRRKSADGVAPPGISKADILEHAAKLAREEPFSEITIARLSRDLGVVPGLIHYFVGSRDELLSLVINQALKQRAELFPPLTDDWRADLEALMRHTIEMQIRWKGITTYVASHNKYRLFQRVEEGERDYGLVFFDHVGQILRRSGLKPSQAAMAFHLLMLFATAVAGAAVNRQEPALHKSFILGHLAQFPSSQYPGAAFISKPFSSINTVKTVGIGLNLLLDGIAEMVGDTASVPRAQRVVGKA